MTFKLNIDMFNSYEVILLIEDDFDAVLAYLNKTVYDTFYDEQGSLDWLSIDWLSAKAGATFLTNSSSTVIWQRSCSTTDIDDVATLCHEALHCAVDICDKLGIDITDDKKEILAYLQEYIVRYFLKLIQRQENKQTKTK